jgi:hypothetical protein
MKHYVLQKGVYVYERSLGDQRLLVFMNGTSGEVEINPDRYAESIQGNISRTDLLTGETISLKETLTLKPKQVYILE